MTSPPSPNDVTEVSTPPRSVMVATRDAALGRMIAMALRVQGRQPHLYSNGQQTLDALLAEPYTAALLDSHLPTVDGFTICERVRASTSTASAVPIVLLLLQEDTTLWQGQKTTPPAQRRALHPFPATRSHRRRSCSLSTALLPSLKAAWRIIAAQAALAGC